MHNEAYLFVHRNKFAEKVNKVTYETEYHDTIMSVTLGIKKTAESHEQYLDIITFLNKSCLSECPLRYKSHWLHSKTQSIEIRSTYCACVLSWPSAANKNKTCCQETCFQKSRWSKMYCTQGAYSDSGEDKRPAVYIWG